MLWWQCSMSVFVGSSLVNKWGNTSRKMPLSSQRITIETHTLQTENYEHLIPESMWHLKKEEEMRERERERDFERDEKQRKNLEHGSLMKTWTILIILTCVGHQPLVILLKTLPAYLRERKREWKFVCVCVFYIRNETFSLNVVTPFLPLLWTLTDLHSITD